MQDLELDIPDAAHFVALFLGRATVDEVLPPAFLTAVLQRLHDDSLGVQVVRSVGQSAQPPSALLILVSSLRQTGMQVPDMHKASYSWSLNQVERSVAAEQDRTSSGIAHAASIVCAWALDGQPEGALLLPACIDGHW